MTATIATADVAADVEGVRALLAALRRSGWTYRRDYVESGRDWDGAPWHEGWYQHKWRRGEAEIFVSRRVLGELVDSINLMPDHEGDVFWVTADLRWVAAKGIDALRELARAAGVFDKEAT